MSRNDLQVCFQFCLLPHGTESARATTCSGLGQQEGSGCTYQLLQQSAVPGSGLASEWELSRAAGVLGCRPGKMGPSCLFPVFLVQLIVEQQDEQLELVSGSIGVLKSMSQRIGGELEEQAV